MLKLLVPLLLIMLINSDEIMEKNEDYFPKDILEKYAEYIPLEEYQQVCNYENNIVSSAEETIKEKIIQNISQNTKNCVPDGKSLVAILENGWNNLAEFIIKDIYFPKLIDPSQLILTFSSKSELKLKSLVQFINMFSNSATLSPKYTYENFDDKIKFNIVLPDASYIPDYISIFCYKDSFKINSIFKYRSKVYRINESKQFYDSISGECEYNFNSFNNQIELSFKKLNIMNK
jgi:hypothetical protein